MNVSLKVLDLFVKLRECIDGEKEVRETLEAEGFQVAGVAAAAAGATERVAAAELQQLREENEHLRVFIQRAVLLSDKEKILLTDGEKIKAIRSLRERYPIGLKEAKEVADKYLHDFPVDRSF